MVGAAGLLPAKLWRGQTPASVRHFSDLDNESGETYLWCRPRASVMCCGILIITIGGIIAVHLELGIFTDGANAAGIFLVICGVMAFSIGVLLTLPEILAEDKDTPVIAVATGGMTCLWGVIVGASMVASDHFERRLVGLGVVLVVVCIILMMLFYLMLHVVSLHYDESTHAEQGDPSNVYAVLNKAREQAIADTGSDEPPALWSLLRSARFSGWFSQFIKLFLPSILFIFIGGLLKSVDKDLINLGQEVIDTTSAIGEVFLCAGAAGLIYALPAVLVQFVPENRILSSDFLTGYPDRVKNGAAHGSVLIPVLLFNAVWIVGRGGDRLGNGDSTSERFAATVLLVLGGLIGIHAALRTARMIFGMRLTEIFFEFRQLKEAPRAAASTSDAHGSTRPPVDGTPVLKMQRGPLGILPKVQAADRMAADYLDVLPPDDELMPYPTRILKEINYDLWPSGLSAADAGRILQMDPWRRWWGSCRIPVYIFPVLGLTSGFIEVMRRDIWNPPPTAWLVLLAPFLGEVSAAMTGLCFLYSISISLQVIPGRGEFEGLFNALNFFWLLIRAGHDFTSEEPGQRLAGVWLVVASVLHLRRLLMSVLIFAARAATHISAEDLKQLGQEPQFFPLMHLASLLAPGDRWNIWEFRRELHRDPVLMRWNRSVKIQILGCLLLAICGGILKDDILFPVIDLMLDGKVLSQNHEDMHNHFLRPVGSIMAAVGATLMLQRLFAPLIEVVLWILNEGLPCRQKCADFWAAGLNSLWLVVYVGFEVSSEYRSQRIIATFLLTFAVLRGGIFLCGGLLLCAQQKKAVPAAAPGPHIDVILRSAIDVDASVQSSSADLGRSQSSSSVGSTAQRQSSQGSLGRPRSSSSVGIEASLPQAGGLARSSAAQRQTSQDAVQRQSSQGSPTGTAQQAQPHVMVDTGTVAPVQVGQSAVEPATQEEADSAERSFSFRLSKLNDPDTAALISSMPLIAKLGFVEADGPLGHPDRSWDLTRIGFAWLFANLVASLIFFFVSSLLQKQWQYLRDGEIDSRAVVAAFGAIMMIVTFVNGIICFVRVLNGLAKLAR